MKRLLGFAAAALLLAGLVVGFALPVNSGEYDCGSAFVESDDVGVDEMVDIMSGGEGQSGCDEARSGARTLPVVLLILGAVAAIGILFVPDEEKRPEPVA